DEFQVLNVMSTAGASILGIGYLMPMIYLIWSLWYGEIAGPNPWRATGLEWQTPSPPPRDNFATTPIVTTGPYEYSRRRGEHGWARGGTRPPVRPRRPAARGRDPQPLGLP